MQVKNLFLKNLVNKRTLFLQYYKQINISDLEALVLLHIMNINDNFDEKLSIKTIQQYCGLNEEEIQDIINSLFEKKIIEVEVSSKNTLHINFEFLFEKILTTMDTKDKLSQKDELFGAIEEITKTKVTDNETRIINNWLFDGFTNELKGLIKKLNKANQKIDFDGLEDTMELIIQAKKNNKDLEEVLGYNWLN